MMFVDSNRTESIKAGYTTGYLEKLTRCELLDRSMVEKVNPYVSTGMVCDVYQELSPKAISVHQATGCSQSLITSDCLAGIGHSNTGHIGKNMVVRLHLAGIGHSNTGHTGVNIVVRLHKGFLFSEFVTGPVVVGVLVDLPFGNIGVSWVMI